MESGGEAAVGMVTEETSVSSVLILRGGVAPGWFVTGRLTEAGCSE